MKECKKILWWTKHNWNKWEIIENGEIANEYGKIMGRYFYQQRTCEQCGFTELDKQKK